MTQVICHAQNDPDKEGCDLLQNIDEQHEVWMLHMAAPKGPESRMRTQDMRRPVFTLPWGKESTEAFAVAKRAESRMYTQDMRRTVFTLPCARRRARTAFVRELWAHVYCVVGGVSIQKNLSKGQCEGKGQMAQTEIGQLCKINK